MVFELNILLAILKNICKSLMRGKTSGISIILEEGIFESSVEVEVQ